MPQITCLDDLAQEAKAMKEKATIAVVEAHDKQTIEAVLGAQRDGIIHPVLIGHASGIAELLTGFGAASLDFEILSSGSEEASLTAAMDLIHSGGAAALMKGKIETAGFMKAVIDEEKGLLTGSRLSLAALYETTAYHKLFAVSDVVVNTYPDLNCKRAIVENAVRMLGMLGIRQPKVAVLAAVEKLNPKMQDTVDAYELKKMNENGVISGCTIEGPISFDLATSAEAAGIKGYNSPVAGDADLLIVPDITAGNILAKCLTGLAGARTAGIVLGAKVPIVLTSRSADASDKYYSIALAAYVGGKQLNKESVV